MEFLKPILGDQLYLAVQKKIAEGSDVKLANLATGGYVAKEKFLALVEKATALETQLVAANAKLKAASQVLNQAKELEGAVAQLQQEKEQMGRQFEEKLIGVQKEAAIENALIEAKAKSKTAARALIDESKITFLKGEPQGLKAQIDAIQHSDPYLFEIVRDTGGGTNPPDTSESMASTNPDRMDDKTFYNIKFKK